MVVKHQNYLLAYLARGGSMKRLLILLILTGCHRVPIHPAPASTPPSRTLDQILIEDEDMAFGCASMAGEVEVNCQKAYEAFQRARAITTARISPDAKGIKMGWITFFKKAGVGDPPRFQFGLENGEPLYIMGYFSPLPYPLIAFSREWIIEMEAYHALYWWLRSDEKRTLEARLQADYEHPHVWQIVGHDTSDDPLKGINPPNPRR